jgi:outer membrane lipoprotein
MRKSVTAHLQLYLLGAAILLSGCAPVFPREMTDRVDRSLTFRDVLDAPDKYVGSWVMFAGVVISTKNDKEGSLIEILQKPADDNGRPLDTDSTGGRFLAYTMQFLDPAVYHEGRLITVIGVVKGRKSLPLDEITYHYPLLDVEALHLWNPSTQPRFFFGVGISGRM